MCVGIHMYVCIRVCMYTCVCVYTDFLYPFTHWWTLGCFCILACVNNATMTMGVQISFHVSVSISFRYVPRGRIAGLHGRSVFKVWGNLHTIFYSGCTSLHSHQQCTEVSFSPHLCKHLLFLVFWIVTHQVWSNVFVWFWFAFPW